MEVEETKLSYPTNLFKERDIETV